MKQIYLTCYMVLLLYAGARAQNQLYASQAAIRHSKQNVSVDKQLVVQINGKVSDETGAGFPGVNIFVKGGTMGTSTDSNGNYALEVPDKSTVLVFSFIGYVTKE